MIVKNPFHNLKHRLAGFIGKSLSSASVTHTIDHLEEILKLDSSLWKNFKSYAVIYNTVSAVRTVLDVKAQAMANVRFIVREAKTREIIPFNSGNDAANKLYRLMANPNPLQSTKEFVRSESVYHDTFGKSFVYASVPVGFENRVNLDSVDTLTPLPASYMRTIYTGKFFDTLSINEIIEKYQWIDESQRKEFVPSTILERSNVSMCMPTAHRSTDFQANQLSKLYSLQKEISNFIISLESRNVMGRKRGALGIFVSAMKTKDGTFPLSNALKKDVDEAFEKYGTLEHQNQFVHTKAPIDFKRVAMNPKELMLLEESWQDIIAIANAYGVPEVLVKLYIEGATFENQKEAERRLYQRTVIPEMKDKVNDLSLFLKLEEAGLVLEASYDHVEVLQANRKEEAETDKINSDIAKDLFLAGAYTYNNWLTEIDKIPIEEAWGDSRIFDLEEEQIQIILGSFNLNDAA